VIHNNALSLLEDFAQQQEGSRFLPGWAWLLIILALFIVFWLLYRLNKKTEVKVPAAPAAPFKMAEKVAEVPQPVVEAEPIQMTEEAVEAPKPAPALHDDLTLIEGIGPKINAILQGSGVNTFAQLAELDSLKIREILTTSGIRLVETATWPGQARLAAEGKMEALKAPQDTLNPKGTQSEGGRTA